MEKVIRAIPTDSKGNPYADGKERNLIFFNVKYNRHRDLCTSTSVEVCDREEWAECHAVLCLPDNYGKTGVKTQLILSCHGAGSTVNPNTLQTGGLWGVVDCVDAGYAALDIDGIEPHGTTMGCPEHVFALYKAYKYAVTHYDLTEKVLLYGGSMGGQTSINFACTFPSLCLALGEFFPRMNIESFTTADGHFCLGTWEKTTPNANGISARDRVIEYFHMDGGDWNRERITGFEPYTNRSFTNEKGEKVVIPPCPIKIWHGTADKTVDPVVSVEYVRAVRRGGCYADLRILDGIGHYVTGTMRAELKMWFDRFI